MLTWQEFEKACKYREDRKRMDDTEAREQARKLLEEYRKRQAMSTRNPPRTSPGIYEETEYMDPRLLDTSKAERLPSGVYKYEGHYFTTEKAKLDQLIGACNSLGLAYSIAATRQKNPDGSWGYLYVMDISHTGDMMDVLKGEK